MVFTVQKPAIERLLDQVSPEPMSGCWLFTGSLDRDGYGQFRVGSRTDGSYRNTRAHTFAYKSLRGLIPAGMTLDHKCRMRSCANPDHLEPVTNGVNVLRGDGPSARNAR